MDYRAELVFVAKENIGDGVEGGVKMKNFKNELTPKSQIPLNPPENSGQALKGAMNNSLIFSEFPFMGRG